MKTGQNKQKGMIQERLRDNADNNIWKELLTTMLQEVTYLKILQEWGGWRWYQHDDATRGPSFLSPSKTPPTPKFSTHLWVKVPLRESVGSSTICQKTQEKSHLPYKPGGSQLWTLKCPWPDSRPCQPQSKSPWKTLSKTLTHGWEVLCVSPHFQRRRSSTPVKPKNTSLDVLKWVRRTAWLYSHHPSSNMAKLRAKRDLLLPMISPSGMLKMKPWGQQQRRDSLLRAACSPDPQRQLNENLQGWSPASV